MNERRHTLHPIWEPRLVELLQSYERPFEETGAELEITWPEDEGGATRVLPLARHYRFEEDEGGLLLLWIRPIVGGYIPDPGGPRYAFHLNEARRHAIDADTIEVASDGNLRGSFGDGGSLVIRPVSGERRSMLDAWDTFTYVTLDDEDLTALEALEGDSWLGGEWE